MATEDPVPNFGVDFVDLYANKYSYGFQEVLWDDPPIPECEATCALFYSISSTQVKLAFLYSKKQTTSSFSFFFFFLFQFGVMCLICTCMKFAAWLERYQPRKVPY